MSVAAGPPATHSAEASVPAGPRKGVPPCPESFRAERAIAPLTTGEGNRKKNGGPERPPRNVNEEELSIRVAVRAIKQRADMASEFTMP